MALVSRTVLAVWFALMAITLVSWWLGSGHGIDPNVTGSAILVLSFVKARLVAMHFMEVQHAPWGLRLGVEVLLGLACVVLVTFLLVT